jgi:hypothetical protein
MELWEHVAGELDTCVAAWNPRSDQTSTINAPCLGECQISLGQVQLMLWRIEQDPSINRGVSLELFGYYVPRYVDEERFAARLSNNLKFQFCPVEMLQEMTV